MSTTRCWCPCHVGGAKATHIPPDVRSPVDAVTACSQCLNAHTIALVSDWPIVPPVNPQYMPWVDVVQADGDQGEGPET